MVMTISDTGGIRPTSLPPPLPERGSQAFIGPVAPQPRQSEPTWHPQVQAPAAASCGPSSAGGAYGIPEGQSLSGVAGGTEAQPFDVTLSQLATAVYETRGGPPCGWSAVTAEDFPPEVSDPAAWREQFLSGGDQLNGQEFVAEIYTDGNGNFVLAYQGTEGASDWANNFTQGTGFETPGDGPDKFSDLAAATAQAFEDTFGDGAPGESSSNLAITGHSQGGGLASAGSLATGVPAVTFDGSGLHPNTLDRLGLTPAQARDIAEGGQIRAYSLDSDLLTQAQESGPLGLIAPDALGTSIVVAPAPADAVTLAGEVAGIEFGLGPTGQAIANGVVEGLRNSSDPLLGGVGDLIYSAASHNPNVLTEAMVAQQPWQAGYQNPSDPGKWLQGLVPDAVHDAIAVGTHEVIDTVIDVASLPAATVVGALPGLVANGRDLAADAGQVLEATFASGDLVQGLGSLAGDVADFAFDSAGDLVHSGADAVAATLEEHGGPVGGVVSDFVRFGGDVAHTASDFAGDVAEVAGDVGGWLFGR